MNFTDVYIMKESEPFPTGGIDLKTFESITDFHFILSKFSFTPASFKTEVVDIPGASGSIDLTESLTGSPSYENMSVNISFDAIGDDWLGEFATTDGGQAPSKEGKFFSLVNGGRIKIFFIDKSKFSSDVSTVGWFVYIVGRATIKSYDRTRAFPRIELEIDADPFWYESYDYNTMWSVTAAENLFLDENFNVLLKSSRFVSCYLRQYKSGSAIFIKGNMNDYAIVSIAENLDPEKTYSLSMTQSGAKCTWAAYADGVIVNNPSNITGASEITLRITVKESLNPAYLRNIELIDTSFGVSSGTLQTLDNPITSIYVTSNGIATLVINGEQIIIPTGNKVPVYGILLPARSEISYVIYSEMDCSGTISYRRGTFSCTR